MKTDVIAPSILAIREAGLDVQEMVTRVEPFVRTLHIDIMDRRFVKNFSFRPSEINQIDSNLQRDIHLMVVHPEVWFSRFTQPHCFFVHAELPHCEKLMALLRQRSLRVGLALNPETDVRSYVRLFSKADAALVMSVHPGRGGQSFLPLALKKIRALNKLKRLRIVVDGGITPENAKKILNAGADQLVMGSALFKHNDPESVMKKLREGKIC